MAFNVIIIAVIGLVVLAVLLFIFGGKVNVFSKGVSDCEAIGGVCQENVCSGPELQSGVCTSKDPNVKLHCCSKVIS